MENELRVLVQNGSKKGGLRIRDSLPTFQMHFGSSPSSPQNMASFHAPKTCLTFVPSASYTSPLTTHFLEAQ